MIYPDRYSRNFLLFWQFKKKPHVCIDASQKKKIEASFIRFNKSGSIILQIRIFNYFFLSRLRGANLISLLMF